MINRSSSTVFAVEIDNKRGLIGWWPFDNGDATDITGNQNNGVKTGSPVFSTSPFGNSFGFSTGNYFLVSTLGLSNPIATNAVSVACWFKPNDVNGRSDLISVWVNDAGGSSDQFLLTQNVTATAKPEFYVGIGTAQSSGVGSILMVNDVWYHLAGTFDGTNVSIYLNGKLEATAVHAGTLGNGTSNPIQIGGSVGSTHQCNGSLADVRIYNRNLSDQEINDLYNIGTSIFSLSSDEWQIPALYIPASGSVNLMGQIWM